VQLNPHNNGLKKQQRRRRQHQKMTTKTLSTFILTLLFPSTNFLLG
jgi:hypothetical protein